MHQRIVAGLHRKLADMLLAILLGYNGNESEVVDPHKKTQLIFVVMSKEGAMHQRIVAGLRRKLADILLAILLGYNKNESEVVDPHKETQIIFVVSSKEGAIRRRICYEAAQEACQESVYRLQRNVVLIAGRELLEKFALQQAMCRSVPNWLQLSFVLVNFLDIVTLS